MLIQHCLLEIFENAADLREKFSTKWKFAMLSALYFMNNSPKISPEELDTLTILDPERMNGETASQTLAVP